MAHTTESPAVTGSSDAFLLGVRIMATLSLLVLLAQFVTAGRLVVGVGGEELHATGAIVLHVTTGLVMLAAAAGWWLRGHPLWPTVLATVVFVLSFVQAYAGSHGLILVHVPGAMILTVGTAVLTVWSFRPSVGR